MVDIEEKPPLPPFFSQSCIWDLFILDIILDKELLTAQITCLL